LSYRDVEEMMFERRIVVSYEAIRAWCAKFGAEYSKRLKKCRGPIGDTWGLDEVYLKIAGRHQYLWRAVDQEGEVVDILVQSHRDANAAQRLAALVPRPRLHLIRFHGVLAPNAKLRAKVVPQPLD
jgi:putative transposase